MTEEQQEETESNVDRRKRWAADIMLRHEECGGNELRALWEDSKIVGVWCPEHGKIVY